MIINKKLFPQILRYFQSYGKDEKLLMMKKIEETHKKGKNSLQKLIVAQTRHLKDQNIQILFQLTPLLEKKHRISTNNKINPFIPPFEDGVFISDLMPKHRLLNNKYYIYDHQLLIVTQEEEKQSQRINLQDFKHIYTLMTVIDGCYFYNCGPNSGYSQLHKHIQILPHQSLKLPIIQHLLSSQSNKTLKNNKQVVQNKNLLFLHGIKYLSGEQSPLDLKQNQSILFNQMRSIIGNSNFGFNIIGCRSFMMIVPRLREYLHEGIGINALGFMGVIHFTNLSLLNTVFNKYQPTEILSYLAYPKK